MEDPARLAAAAALPSGGANALVAGSVSGLLFCLRYRLHKINNTFLAAGLRLEFELAHPRPQNPREPWLSFAEKRERSRGYRRKLARWREMRKEAFACLTQASPRLELEVDNVFALYRREKAITRYLEVLYKGFPKEENRDRFLCRIRIKYGFLAPLHLVQGLLSQFDEDWQPLINEFNENAVSLPALWQPLQSFIYRCWLLWGPSIPVCTCPYWHSGIALQYGYGDENNSFPLYIPAEQRQAALSSIREHFQQAAAGTSEPPLAYPVSVRCFPRWGRSLAETDLGGVQQGLRNPEEYGFILEYVSHQAVGDLSGFANYGYYSAYIWVMFVIEDRTSEAPNPRTPWLNLIPFFEHSNIAHGPTYSLMKEQLARKALNFIRRLKEIYHARDSGGSFPLRFYYACASDDSNCADHHQHWQLAFGFLESKRLREVIERLLATEFSDLQAEELVRFDSEHAISACHLSEEVIGPHLKSIQESARLNSDQEKAAAATQQASDAWAG